MEKGNNLAAYLFLAPFLTVLGIFFVYATVRAAFFSFTDYTLFNEPSWVGLQNYIDLFKENNFLRALQNSVVYAIVVTIVQTFLALVVASALNARIRGIHIFRAAYYVPSVASSVVITIIFLWLYQRRGLFNFLATKVKEFAPYLLVGFLVLMAVQLIQVVAARRRKRPARPSDPAFFVMSVLVTVVVLVLGHLSGVLAPRQVEPVDFIWLQTRQMVLGIVSVPLMAIMIQNTFTTIPTFMLLFLAGLQDVPKQLYEAAHIDGANTRQQFFHITIPALRPVTFLVVTLSLIGTLQMFDQVAIFGDAVPMESVITLAYFTYDRMFPGAQLPEVGLASAAALFLALFTLVVVLVQRLFLKSEAE